MLAGRARFSKGGATSSPYDRRAMSNDLEDAWGDLHDATPAGLFVGRPSYDEGRRVWEHYAFDPSGRAQVGVRSREWTAVAPSELEVIRELARCLGPIRESRVPG